METERFSRNDPPAAAAACLRGNHSSFAFMSIPALLILAAAMLFVAGCEGDDVSSPGEEQLDGLYPPELVIWEPFLGTGIFRGRTMFPATAQVLAGISYSFQWQGISPNDPLDHYSYRYGWDIEDPETDTGWAVPWNPYSKHSEPMSFESGVHVFYAEVKNLSGEIARARVSVEVIPYRAQRDLLWIDDYLLDDYSATMMEPGESVHDAFWTEICSAVPGWNPARDVFPADVQSIGEHMPLEVLADYRSVVWTWGSHSFTTWRNTINFTPRLSLSTFPRPNTLKMFLAAGGRALTCGRASRAEGGLSAIFLEEPECPVTASSELLSFEYDPRYSTRALPFDEFHITAIDEVIGNFRTDLGVTRDLTRDAMRMALETGAATGLDLPDTLVLDEQVTCPVCFFNPEERGFYYVEAYDPSYIMDYLGVESHPCFTPLYLMRTRNSVSPLDWAPVALRMDPRCSLQMGYTDPAPGSAGASSTPAAAWPAPRYSYHFGFPLWFMDHDSVRQLTSEIFYEWGIK